MKIPKEDILYLVQNSPKEDVSNIVFGIKVTHCFVYETLLLSFYFKYDYTVNIYFYN